MKTKLCRKCFKEKDSKEFYIRERNSDGLSSYCRKCSRKIVLDWRKENPNKRKAHQAVATALKNKLIIKPNCCQKCNRECYVVAHHPDYRSPLKIEWLCDSCHVKAHWINKKYYKRNPSNLSNVTAQVGDKTKEGVEYGT